MGIPSPPLSLDQALSLVGRQPALVIGPAATCYRGVLKDVARFVTAKLNNLALPADSEDIYKLGDIVATVHETSLMEFRIAVADEINRLQPSSNLSILAASNWVACVSLTSDVLYERAIRERLDKQASSRTLTVISAPRMTIPTRSSPVYKLLGMLTDSEEEKRAAFSKADLLFRITQWPGLLSTLPDFMRDSPLFFVGTEEVPELTAQFLACLYAGPRPHPNHLIFLKDDPSANLPEVSSVLRRSGAKVNIVDADVRQFVAALDNSKHHQKQLELHNSSGTRLPNQRAEDALSALKYICRSCAKEITA
jgi:hypothetical protein